MATLEVSPKPFVGAWRPPTLRQRAEHRGLVDADQVGGDPPDAGGERRRHLVGVDLVARHDQQVRPGVRGVGPDPGADQVGGRREGVEAGGACVAARRVEDDEIVEVGRQAGERRQRRIDGQVGPVRLGRPAGRGQPVVVERAGGELAAGGVGGDGREPQMGTDLHRRGGGGRRRRGLPRRLDVQGDVVRTGDREPHGHVRSRQPTQHRPREHRWQVGDGERSRIERQRGAPSRQSPHARAMGATSSRPRRDAPRTRRSTGPTLPRPRPSPPGPDTWRRSSPRHRRRTVWRAPARSVGAPGGRSMVARPAHNVIGHADLQAEYQRGRAWWRPKPSNWHWSSVRPRRLGDGRGRGRNRPPALTGRRRRAAPKVNRSRAGPE